MKPPRAAIALYLALALHALLLLGLALRPPSQDAAGTGRGISLAGSGMDTVDAAGVETPTRQDAPLAAQVETMKVETAQVETAQVEAPAVTAAPAARRRAPVAGGGAGPRDAYLYRVRVHLAGHRRELPAGTGRGRAQVAFRIDSDGRVGDLDLVESSGLAVLDAEALDLVQRASPLPPPPQGAMRVVVPLSIGR